MCFECGIYFDQLFDNNKSFCNCCLRCVDNARIYYEYTITKKQTQLTFTNAGYDCYNQKNNLHYHNYYDLLTNKFPLLYYGFKEYCEFNNINEHTNVYNNLWDDFFAFKYTRELTEVIKNTAFEYFPIKKANKVNFFIKKFEL